MDTAAAQRSAQAQSVRRALPFLLFLFIKKYLLVRFFRGKEVNNHIAVKRDAEATPQDTGLPLHGFSSARQLPVPAALHAQLLTLQGHYSTASAVLSIGAENFPNLD